MDRGPSKQPNRRLDNDSRVAVTQGLVLREMFGDAIAAAFLRKKNVSLVLIHIVLTRPS